MEIIATIALVTALSKMYGGFKAIVFDGADVVMKTPARTWWLLGVTMFLFSLFCGPPRQLLLVGAIMIPFAVRAGLHLCRCHGHELVWPWFWLLSYDVW